MIDDLASYFDSPERNKGVNLLRKELVVISSSSDTDVRAFVKGSSACRVGLVAEQVGGHSFSASCNCTQARKGQLCKHIWAVLLKLEELDADFLNGKTEVLAPRKEVSAAEQARLGKQEKYKLEKRQKLKARSKEIRAGKKRAERGSSVIYPQPVQESLMFFASNGFALEEFDIIGLLSARKLLSRVFHPDKGGSHDEILQLTAHFETLENYLKS